MDELIKKISAYDLFNNLIPGVITALFFDRYVFAGGLFELNVAVVLVVCYVLGVLGSRVGSLLLEPLMVKFGLIKRDYPDFIRAQKADQRIDTLVTIANMYRALAGSVVLSCSAFLYSRVLVSWRPAFIAVAVALTFILLLAAWCKQDHYVTQRVEACTKKEEEEEEHVSD